MLADLTVPVKNSILYVCEPIREHALKQMGDEQYFGYTEESALEYFLSNLSAVAAEGTKIVVRPHPSENPCKYNWVLDRSDWEITIGGKEELISEVKRSTVVVGCESMAMVIGLMANKRVISSIPPGGRLCQLPHKEVVHLAQLVERSEQVEI